VYIPDEGGLWGSLDYSQQEPRLAVHFAIASGMQRLGQRAFASAEEAARRYWSDRNTDAHTMFTQLVHGDDALERLGKAGFKQARTILKNIYLGICYGMGEPKMCRQLGLPTKIKEDERSGKRFEVAGDEGRAILDQIEARVPYVKATAKAVEKVAKARGYIVTIGGRRCRFAKDQFGNFDWTHKAFNRAIQGSAADQTKAAMVALDREGFPLQLQVHDEFDWSLGSVEEGRRAAEIMENVIQLKVPSKVDLEVGPSWGEIKDAA
jgi:DNA polymerase I-like protein with 3'-5' exonuclease and polymerase domains